MGCHRDGYVTAELLPRFALFVDGDDSDVFPPRGNCAPIPASLEEIQQDLQKRLGGLFQHPIHRWRLTFLTQAKARLSSVQVSGVLTARLLSGTACVKVASISRRNCCLSAGRLSVSLASAKAFCESVRFALGRGVLCAAVLQVRIRNNALLLHSSDLLPHRS